MPGAAAGAFAAIAIANNIARARKGIDAAKTACKAVAGLTLGSEKIEGAVAQATGTERPVSHGSWMRACRNRFAGSERAALVWGHSGATTSGTLSRAASRAAASTTA